MKIEWKPIIVVAGILVFSGLAMRECTREHTPYGGSSANSGSAQASEYTYDTSTIEGKIERAVSPYGKVVHAAYFEGRAVVRYIENSDALNNAQIKRILNERLPKVLSDVFNIPGAKISTVVIDAQWPGAYSGHNRVAFLEATLKEYRPGKPADRYSKYTLYVK